MCLRRQELRELRYLQKDEQRAQAALNAKLETQREQMQRRNDQDMNVSQFIFHIHYTQALNVFIKILSFLNADSLLSRDCLVCVCQHCACFLWLVTDQEKALRCGAGDPGKEPKANY